MDWIDITRWAWIAIWSMCAAWNFSRIKKEEKDNPCNHIGILIMYVKMWIIFTFIMIATNKISIALLV